MGLLGLDRPVRQPMPSIMSEDGGQTWREMPPLGKTSAAS